MEHSHIVKDILLTEQMTYQVVDRFEELLADFNQRGIINLNQMAARSMALGLFVEIFNVVNPPAPKVRKIEVKYEASN